jgi:phosphoglycolate phosphatase
MIKAVIFDFDGVLADTFDKTLDICRQLFTDVSLDDFKDHHNGNVYEKPVIKFNKKDEEIYHQEYLKRADAKRFFPLIEQIKQISRYHKLYIISSNSEISINKYLELTGVEKYFERVMGVETEKSKKAKFKILFNECAHKPDNCVFVTDTLGDLLEAKAVNIRTIAVTWGYHDEIRLKSGNPDTIIHNFDELAESIDKFHNSI